MNKRRCMAIGAMLVVGLLLGSLPAAAQFGTRGGVRGEVIGPDGKPIVGAQVIFTNLTTKRKMKMKTDKHGEYFGVGLLPGSYDITVLVDGQEHARREKVAVHGGQYGDPNNPGGFRNKFDFVFRMVSDEEAQKQAEESMKAASAYDRAVALNKAGRFQQALGELQPLLEVDPEQWVVHAQIAVALIGLKRYQDAEAATKRAIEFNPSNANLYNHLGQIYISMGRIEDAKHQFETAAQLSPEDAGTFYFNLGVTFYNQGQLRAAVEPLRKALEVDPARADAYYWLGVCLYSTAETKIEGGEVKTILPPDTRKSFESYLVLEPNGRYAKDAKQYLQIIEASVPAAVRVKK